MPASWKRPARGLGRRWWNLRRLGRIATAPARMLPDFLIIGEAKAGTTSLYRYLAEHPGVAPAFTKEVHYFDLHYRRGLAWYRAHFPLAAERLYAERVLGRPFVTGESSPYLFHPCAAERIERTVPRARFLVLLRNPIDRAFSHYTRQTLRAEALSFEEAVEQEADRLAGEAERLRVETGARSVSHRKRSYLARGIYADRLQAWMARFPREQFCILNSERFFADPRDSMAQVCDFLRPPVVLQEAYPKYNVSRYRLTLEPARRRLVEYFAPHNQRLYGLLGMRFEWER